MNRWRNPGDITDIPQASAANRTTDSEGTATNPTALNNASVRTDATATIDSVLVGYGVLLELTDTELRDRNVDPVAFRALLDAQTKLAGVMKKMLN